ncbi:MAG: hypothetical protein JWP12_1591 [Bacteroidetes bacterium]|nr:hypothetical protein [Bacteroidota bacterium]
MANIEKIFENLNLPKQLLDKSEALLKTLFGPSFNEVGEMIADQVRLRRFTNQIKIFSKAVEKLEQNKINPQKVSLKILAPLIEYSSLEEEESLQDKWSNLVAHILQGDKDVVFQQNCISILNKLSSLEAKLLDDLHKDLSERRKKVHAEDTVKHEQRTNAKLYQFLAPPNTPEGYKLSRFSYSVIRLSKEMKIPRLELEFSISNLISLGLLMWETDVLVKAEKTSDDPENTEIDVDVDVSNSNKFTFTSIGDRFVRICNEA